MTRRHLFLLVVLLTLPSSSLSYTGEPREVAGTEAKRPMLVAPFTREEAVAAQKECSEGQGSPVEITNSLWRTCV